MSESIAHASNASEQAKALLVGIADSLPWTYAETGGTYLEPEPPEYVVRDVTGRVIFGDAYPGTGLEIRFIAAVPEIMRLLIAEIARLQGELEVQAIPLAGLDALRRDNNDLRARIASALKECDPADYEGGSPTSLGARHVCHRVRAALNHEPLS